ncbi:MAG: ribosome small subunit-dependent GTPase A [Planctomycetes bacterium]|nr:ribosome small subunit-dependent GTPase A [Planctomycetota bacterium]
MPDTPDGKYKGTRGPQPRQGMGKLRRASRKPDTRASGWERHQDDDHFLDRHAQVKRASHPGENLLARFNRLAQEHEQQRALGEDALVCGFAGSSIVVRLGNGGEIPCEMRRALMKRVSGVRNPICVGDRVRVDRTGTTPVINALHPRTSLLARTDSHNKSLVHVLCANVDRLVVVSSLADPVFKPAFVDRYLLIALLNGIPPTVVLNKRDLGDAEPAAALYRDLGHPVFTTDARHDGASAALDELRNHLRGAITVFAGQSGVGKSSLINALYPLTEARVGVVSGGTGLGRHTTTSARGYALPDGGTLIDTPGIKECGITGLNALDVALLYPDLARWHHQCRFNDCTHRHEPGCAVQAAVERGEIAASRYFSYRAIVEEDLGLGG